MKCDQKLTQWQNHTQRESNKVISISWRNNQTVMKPPTNKTTFPVYLLSHTKRVRPEYATTKQRMMERVHDDTTHR